MVRLGEVTEITSGQVDPRDKQFQHEMFVAPDDIEPRTGRLINNRTVRDAQTISGKYQFRDGDVLYSKIRPYLMKAYVPRESGLCSADVYPIQPAPMLNPSYLAAFLLSNAFADYVRTCSDRTGIPKVNREDLFKCSLSLPPLAEQGAIVALLDCLDRAIERGREEREGLQAVNETIADGLLTGRLQIGASS